MVYCDHRDLLYSCNALDPSLEDRDNHVFSMSLFFAGVNTYYKPNWLVIKESLVFEEMMRSIVVWITQGLNFCINISENYLNQKHQNIRILNLLTYMSIGSEPSYYKKNQN